MPQLAEVVPLTPVDGSFTYVLPLKCEFVAIPGARVVVPFGRRNVMGVVAERSEGEPDGLKTIEEVLDGEPTFTKELLDLTKWIADYYICSWGEVLKAALPKGLIWSPRAQNGAPVRIKTARHLRLVEGVDVQATLAELKGRKQKALVEALAEAGTHIPQTEALRVSGASSATVKGLIERGWVEALDVEVERTSDAMSAAIDTPKEVALHASQSDALAAISEAIEAESQTTFLLHGVTGSGKTEVYIRALKRTLAKGKTAIVLVPEIALTPQTVRRFRAHFGDRVTVLHSRMSDGARFDAWRAIRDGRYPIVIGPRSAVLAPLENLGLIVVDEEHETSYKQFDPAPRYHARDVAVMRAYRNGAVCVLGSATPSLESVANARAGKYVLLRMPQRVPVKGREAAPLPSVRVVNLLREKEIRRLKGALSEELRDAIRHRLERREQIILLQNRRGYAPVLTCENCGHTPECRDCAVSLTVHKPKRQLRCHYCGRAERKPNVCPVCDSSELVFLGAGTQRVEEELAAIFPAARVLRMDFDTTTRKGAHRAILDAFGDGEADILLGTQMVAKGLDFPRVTLVGVVDADTGMLMPDFRATERTFQLLAQVAGRAGRHDLPGEVILQTRNPDHPAIRFALAHDFDGFVEHELAERQAFGYPPFGRMIGIEFKGADEGSVRRLAEAWTSELANDAQGVAILGPTPAFVSRVKRQWRYHTLLKAPRSVPASALAGFVRSTIERTGPPKKGRRINVDVDPVGLF